MSPPAGSPPTLPPAALGRLQANALTDRLAVRIINMPQGLQSKDGGPTKVVGLVTGQNSDGSVNIQTDKGVVQLALKDRGGLPAGVKIDIEIPAGRSPQTATIAVDRSAPPASTPAQTEPVTFTSTVDSLEIKQNLTPTSLETVLSSPDKQAIVAQTQIIAEAPVLPDQLLRLTPTNLPVAATGEVALPQATPQAQLLTTLLNALQTTPASADTAILRANLAALLAKLLPTLPPGAASQTLINNIQNALQSFDKQQNIQVGQNGNPPPGAPASPVGVAPPLTTPVVNQTAPPLANPAQTPVLINLAKPLDAQIVGFLPPATASAPTKGASLALPNLNLSGTTPLLTPAGPKPVFVGQYLGTVGPQGQPIISLTPQPQTAPAIPLQNGGTTSSTPTSGPTGPNPAPLTFGLSVTPTNLPVGSTVFLTLEPAVGPVPLPATPVAGTPALATALQGWLAGMDAGDMTWDSLTDMVTLLNHAAPAQAGQLAQMVPSAASPHNAGPLSLFFLSMLRSGDIESWLGDQTAKILSQNARGIELMRALTGESQLLRQVETAPLPQDWRMMMLPFAFGQHIQKTPVYYKHMNDDENAKDARDRKARRMRFLFDLNLNRMGGVQVDGFMQSSKEREANQRLDIILRTKTPLSVPMQGQMKRIYAGAMDKSRLVGDLSFQFRADQFVSLDMGDMAPAAHDAMLV